MSLSGMKHDLHDRLWNAQQRWFAMREDGWTKHAVKKAGISDAGDQNARMRNLLFTGATRTTYEKILKSFVEFAHAKFGAQRLEDIGVREARSFMDAAIEQRLAAKTLHTYRSALSKYGSVTGQTRSFAALSSRYGRIIRGLTHSGQVDGPDRATPSPEVMNRAIEILRAWDTHSNDSRAYHLAARLQLETAARSFSATERMTRDCLLDGNRVCIIGKGGQRLIHMISPALHEELSRHLGAHPGPLADLRGYQAAYRRAMDKFGGKVTGTHGARRLSTQMFYSREYHRLVSAGLSPTDARREARAQAIERLGHSRGRTDQAACYLDRAA